MKKLIAALLCTILFLGLLPVAAEKAEPTVSGDYEYVLLEDGTARITKYTGDAVTLEIAGELDGHAVSSIGKSAFKPTGKLVDVTIPEGVTEIGEHAFSDCRFLTDISIPQSVERIGDLGFCNCKRLTDLTIPGSVTEIGRDAFYMCRDLTLTVPEGSYAEQYAKENEIPYKQ